MWASKKEKMIFMTFHQLLLQHQIIGIDRKHHEIGIDFMF